jgi:hypothetical protein
MDHYFDGSCVSHDDRIAHTNGHNAPAWVAFSWGYELALARSCNRHRLTLSWTSEFGKPSSRVLSIVRPWNAARSTSDQDARIDVKDGCL